MLRKIVLIADCLPHSKRPIYIYKDQSLNIVWENNRRVF